MISATWTMSNKALTDPPRAKHFLKFLAETSAGSVLQKASAEQCAILAELFSGSQALSTLLVSHPDWLESLAPEQLKFPRRKEGLNKEAGAWLNRLLEAQDYAG